MTSEARINANRLNAQKSTGPRTAEGKAAVAQNAVKHGLSARCDVIRGEDQKEFEQYREEMFWELNPAGVMQSRLTERIVSLAWRLRRAERLQNEAFDALLIKETSSPLARLTRPLRGKEQDGGKAEGCDGEPAVGRTVVRDFSNARVLDRLLMYERRIESSLYRTMNELHKLRHTQDREPAGGASVSKASRLRIAGGTPATPPLTDREMMTDSAKQSQILPASNHPPEGGTPSAGNRAKQSQILAGDGVQCTPYESADAPARSQNVIDFAEQSQSRAGDGVQCTAYEGGDASAGDQTPDGVTASTSDCAKQSQSARAEMAARRSSEKGEETPCRRHPQACACSAPDLSCPPPMKARPVLFGENVPMW